MSASNFPRSVTAEEKQISETKDPSDDETVKTIVGPDESIFYLDKQLLINKVPYFKFRLQDDLETSYASPVELPSISVTGFRYVVSWLYNDSLPTLVSDNGIFDESAFDAMYKVAEFLMISELRNKLRSYVCPLSKKATNTSTGTTESSSRE